MMRPSSEATISRLCSFRKMRLTMDLFSQWLSGPGCTSCKNCPVQLQYSRTKPPASPTKNFRPLQPNSQAVMLVQQLPYVRRVKTFQRQPVTQLQTRTSLELKRKMRLVRVQMRQSNITWNSLIYFDFFYREGALNWVTFFSQTRHSDSSGITSSREGLMKFFQQLMIWMVCSCLKSQIRMLSLSSKDSTQGKDLRKRAVRRLPECSLYCPVKPLTSDTSNEQMQMAEQKPQVSTQLPNYLVQSMPRMPFLQRLSIAEEVCSDMCYRATVFLRQREWNLTLPSIEQVATQRGSSSSQTQVMSVSCCFMVATTAKSMAVRLRQEAVHSFSSPLLETKAQYLWRGRYSTLWQQAIFLASHSLQVLTLPITFRLQYLIAPSNSAPSTRSFLSREKSMMAECTDSPFSSRQSTRVKLWSQMRMVVAAVSSRQYFLSLDAQMIFLIGLTAPVSTTLVILYSLLILEQADEMTSFSWNCLFLQLGLSMRRMFSMMYQVNQDHQRCPSPLMSIAWKNLIRSETKQYLLIQFQGQYSFFIKQMKVGNSSPLGYSSNSLSSISMFQWESMPMMRSMCSRLLLSFQKMWRLVLKYSTRSDTVPRLMGACSILVLIQGLWNMHLCMGGIWCQVGHRQFSIDQINQLQHESSQPGVQTRNGLRPVRAQVQRCLSALRPPPHPRAQAELGLKRHA